MSVVMRHRRLEPTPSGPAARRADIEGLRFVAVLLVLAYHFTQAGVSGGVDVFLFISGYFVLGAMMRRAGQGQTVDVGRFYLKTFRRLAPAAWAVAVGTAIAAWSWGHASDRSDYLHQLVASLLYVENVWLVDNRVVYGAGPTYHNPFQHFWSLSVQGQVFLVAPLLVALLGVAMRHVDTRHRSRVLGAVVGSTLLFAMVISFFRTAHDQSGAYFSTSARVWEFLLGAMVALAVQHVRLSQKMAVPLGWSSLCVLLLGGLAIDGATSFPGPAALVPLGAAAGVMVAGATSTRCGVDRLLGHRAFAPLGKYSYALYLTYWPVMVLVLLATGRDALGPDGSLVAFVVAAVAAWLIHNTVERPFRDQGAERGGRRGVRDLALILAAALVVVASAGLSQLQTPLGFGTEALQEDLEGALGGAEWRNAETSAPDDTSPLERSCTMFGVEEGVFCVMDGREYFGAASSSVALVGGSHSGMWGDVLRRVADSEGLLVRTFIRAGCPHSTDAQALPGLEDEQGRNCATWNELVTDRLLEDPPDVVVTTLSRSQAPDGSPEWIPDGYLAVWRELGAAGIPVLAIRQNPHVTAEQWLCLERHPTDLGVCSFERATLFDDALLDDVRLPDNVIVLDATRALCEAGVCPASSNGVVNYADRWHLSGEYVAGLEEELRAEIAVILAQGQRS